MLTKSQSPIPDLIHALKEAVTGEVGFDLNSRLLYSTDASIYQIEPLGVVFPRNLDELSAVVGIASTNRVPLLVRGAGSSLAGQAVGCALVVDCSRHLDQIVAIDPQECTAIIEPGAIMTALNNAAAEHGLQFGPDPASADRATMGGSIASNASGAHSIQYGMTVDHLLSLDAVLADGSQATFEAIPLEEAYRRSGIGSPGTIQNLSQKADNRPRSLESDLYQAALHIRDNYATSIHKNWPHTWRRASGYNLNYLLPWSPSSPPGMIFNQNNESYPPVQSDSINLASLIAGSEGTLAIIKRATVRLVPRSKNTILGVLAYPSLAAACDAVPELLARRPSAVELVCRNLIQLARSVPAYAHQISFLDQLRVSGKDPAALLVIEFSDQSPSQLKEKARNLRSDVLIAESYQDQDRVWQVRKMGLGILLSRPGEPKPVPFIEDMTVPVEHLGRFVRELERILDSHGTRGDFYGHASAGCLHIRPLLNLKTAQGVDSLHTIATEAVDLCLRMGGAVTGEHGDGLARSQWMQRAYGPEIVSAFSELKQAADPEAILNPGKIVNAPPMDENLRYGPDYQVQFWSPNLDFANQSGMDGAIELCNGAGVCRKSTGVMCPSFQATADEMHSTRGRANLLRAMISGRFPCAETAEESVYEALDLCLACKGCKAECPSSVDMAKLKFEFLDHYYGENAYSHHRRPLRDYFFAYIEPIARIGHRLAVLTNLILGSDFLGRGAEVLFGLAHQRKFPPLSQKSLRRLIASGDYPGIITKRRKANRVDVRSADCLFLSDPFTEYFQPEVGIAALEVLTHLGFVVEVLPIVGTGRTLLSKGFLDSAREQASRVMKSIKRADPQGMLPVIGIEPSEIYTLRDEYRDLLPEDRDVEKLQERAFMVDEYLIRPGQDGVPKIMRIANNGQVEDHRSKIFLHGHCYQKTQPPAADGFPTGVPATVQMLEKAGYQVGVIDSGCCGMAGAFGYESEHYDVSMQIGELLLFPAIRDALKEGGLIAAPGVSCQSQIEDGTGAETFHPIVLIEKLVNAA